MSINQGLKGFLQKKSLFTNSSIQSGNQKRDKSNESRKIRGFSPVNRNELTSPTVLINKNQSSLSMQYNPNDMNTVEIKSQKKIKYPEQTQLSLNSPIQQNFQKINKTTSNRNFHQINTNVNNSNIRFRNEPIQNNLIRQTINYSTKFESARNQSAICLENLSQKLHNQISNLNYKIQIFRNKLLKSLTIEIDSLKKKIYEVIEKVFQESQIKIMQYIKIQEAKVAKDVTNMKATLEQYCTKVETMKEQLTQPKWRQIAGELISSELQEKVQNIIKDSNKMSIVQQDIQNLSEDLIPKIQSLLKNVSIFNPMNIT